MQFKKSLLIVSFALAAMLAACGGAPSSPASSSAVEKAEYRTLTAQEAKARMDSGDSIVVLDVRTEAEFEEKHIEGAVLIPNETIISEPPAELPDKDAEILIYCRSGNRSRQAAEKLIGMGYSNVYDFGGINSWPYDTVSGKAEK